MKLLLRRTLVQVGLSRANTERAESHYSNDQWLSNSGRTGLYAAAKGDATAARVKAVMHDEFRLPLMK